MGVLRAKGLRSHRVERCRDDGDGRLGRNTGRAHQIRTNDRGSRAKSTLLSAFVNTVLLEHSYVYSFIFV